MPQYQRLTRLVMAIKKPTGAALHPPPSDTIKGLAPRPAANNATSPRAIKDPRTRLASVMTTIIDKLQVLALRQPRALIVIAEVLDGLLKRQLDVLDDNDPNTEHQSRARPLPRQPAMATKRSTPPAPTGRGRKH